MTTYTAGELLDLMSDYVRMYDCDMDTFSDAERDYYNDLIGLFGDEENEPQYQSELVYAVYPFAGKYAVVVTDRPDTPDSGEGLLFDTQPEALAYGRESGAKPTPRTAATINAQ